MKKQFVVILAFITVAISFVLTRQDAVINAVNPMTSDLPIVPIIILGCVAVAGIGLGVSVYIFGPQLLSIYITGNSTL